MYRFWDQAHPHHEAYDSCATSACGAHAVVTLWGHCLLGGLLGLLKITSGGHSEPRFLIMIFQEGAL